MKRLNNDRNETERVKCVEWIYIYIFFFKERQERIQQRKYRKSNSRCDGLKKLIQRKKKKKTQCEVKWERKKKYSERDYWEIINTANFLGALTCARCVLDKSRHTSWRSLDFLACLPFRSRSNEQKRYIWLRTTTIRKFNYFLWRQKLDRKSLKWIKCLVQLGVCILYDATFYISLCDYYIIRCLFLLNLCINK